MIQRRSRKVAEYIPRMIGGHVKHTGKGIGEFGDPLRVESANQRHRGDVKSGKTDLSGMQEVDRVQIGVVGDRRDEDITSLIKAADEAAKPTNDLGEEESEMRETKARVDLLRFEKKHGYKSGVRSRGAR